MLFPIGFSRDKATPPSSLFSNAYSLSEFRVAAQTLKDVVRFGALNIDSWSARGKSFDVLEHFEVLRANSSHYRSELSASDWGLADALVYRVRSYEFSDCLSFSQPLAALSLNFLVPDRLLYYAVVDESRLKPLLNHCLDVDALNDPSRESFYKVGGEQSLFELPRYH